MGCGLVASNSFCNQAPLSNLDVPIQKSTSRVKEMINSTQNAFEKLKKDLQIKDALVETKEKEIAFLKTQIQDLLKSPKLQ